MNPSNGHHDALRHGPVHDLDRTYCKGQHHRLPRTQQRSREAGRQLKLFMDASSALDGWHNHRSQPGRSRDGYFASSPRFLGHPFISRAGQVAPGAQTSQTCQTCQASLLEGLGLRTVDSERSHGPWRFSLLPPRPLAPCTCPSPTCRSPLRRRRVCFLSTLHFVLFPCFSSLSDSL